jgi:hypothetical protein
MIKDKNLTCKQYNQLLASQMLENKLSIYDPVMSKTKELYKFIYLSEKQIKEATKKLKNRIELLRIKKGEKLDPLYCYYYIKTYKKQ